MKSNKEEMNYMLNTKTIGAVVATSLLFSCDSTEIVGKNPQSSMDSFSYSIGINIGQRIKEQGLDQVSYESFVKGVQDGMNMDSGYAMTDDQMGDVYGSYIAKVQKELSAKLQAETKEKLQTLSKEDGVSILPSKAYFRSIQQGKGLSPQLYDTVVCRFSISTLDGDELMSNFDAEMPFRNTLSVINMQPMQEGFMKSKVGAEFEVIVPNEKYPTNSRKFEDKYGISVYKVKLLDVVPGTPPADNE